MKRKKQSNHFTIETRKIIEAELNQGSNITNISKLLKRDRSNIGREIEKHKQLRLPSTYSGTCCCINKDTCSIRSYNCQASCRNFEVYLCEKLKAPHMFVTVAQPKTDVGKLNIIIMLELQNYNIKNPS